MSNPFSVNNDPSGNAGTALLRRLRTEPGVELAGALAREHGLRRDDEGTPYFAYRDGKQWRQGWFEDLASLARKLAPERAQGYAGLAFFPLGYDQGEIVEGMLSWWAAR